MGCNQLLCLFLIAVLMFSSASSPSVVAANDGEEEAMGESAAYRVTLSIYYETLCHFCAHFIVNQLVKVFDLGLISIVNLRMIPWGNTLVGPDGSIVCQHGSEECFLNTIEACTIDLYPDVEKHFGFIHCMESLISHNKSKEWPNCFATAGLGDKNPMNCYKMGHGKEIEEKYANETANLSPPHTFVPWVVVNDLALEDDYRQFITYICNAYKGNHIPDACKPIPPDNNPIKQKARNLTALAAAEKNVPASKPQATLKE